MHADQDHEDDPDPGLAWISTERLTREVARRAREDFRRREAERKRREVEVECWDCDGTGEEEEGMRCRDCAGTGRRTARRPKEG